ncbi:MAG: AzlD domain-containing protein [Clostridia bacterium]|nr:AzlD domain-containing protein [Clostridia bacterium]MBR6028406.1 AzlD domain-containing protein [Clostridia bacterium]
MSWQTFLPYLVVMAAVTYLIRMLPLTVFRREIKSVFVRSFLYYVPYAVLAAMTIPDIFYATGYVSGGDPAPLWCALCGLVTAVLFAWRGKGLLTVAIAACVGVALAQGVGMMVG